MFLRRFFSNKTFQRKGSKVIGQRKLTPEDRKNDLMEDWTVDDSETIYDQNMVRREDRPDFEITQAYFASQNDVYTP